MLPARQMRFIILALQGAFSAQYRVSIGKMTFSELLPNQMYGKLFG